jgi:hypothetical protein
VEQFHCQRCAEKSSPVDDSAHRQGKGMGLNRSRQNPNGFRPRDAKSTDCNECQAATATEDHCRDACGAGFESVRQMRLNLPFSHSSLGARRVSPSGTSYRQWLLAHNTHIASTAPPTTPPQVERPPEKPPHGRDDTWSAELTPISAGLSGLSPPSILTQETTPGRSRLAVFWNMADGDWGSRTPPPQGRRTVASISAPVRAAGG